MCVQSNCKTINRKYNLLEYCSVNCIKNDFIDFLQNDIKLKNLKIITITLFVYDKNMLDDIMAKSKLCQNITQQSVNEMLDDIFDSINWDYVFKNFDKLDISFTQFK